MTDNKNPEPPAAPQYQLALYGAGDRPKNALTKRLRLSALLGAWNAISAACLLHKDSNKISNLRPEWSTIGELGKKQSHTRSVQGMEFTQVLQALSGFGNEFAKSLDLAYFMLPEYQADIESAADRFTDGIGSKGGVHTLWHVASSGGHMVPGETFTESLQKRISRPDTAVLEIVEPTRDEEMARWLFKERLQYLLENNLQGYDTLFLVRNDLGMSHFSSMDSFDDIADMATTLWLAARGPNQVNMPELLALLRQNSPFAGIWGTKVPVGRPEEPRFRVLGRGVGSIKARPLDGVLRHQCLSALERVKSESSTSLTGLPPLSGSQSVYGLVLPVPPSQLVNDVRKAWAGEGPLSIICCPLISSIYAVRIAPVDWTPLAEEVGVAASLPKSPNGWHQPLFGTYGQFMSAVEKRMQTSVGGMASLWN